MILESTRSKNRLYIDWWLMNHCNYDCSYCADIIKNKSADLPDIKNCLDFIDTVKEHCTKIDKKAEFSITGGEVTQWTFLPDLLKKIRDSGFISTIRSNASPSVDDWQIILENLDAVRLEFHPEYHNLSHFVMIVKSTMKKGVACSLTINMVPDLWKDLENMINRLKSLYPDLPIHKKLLFSDPVVNSKPLTYSEPQIQELENQSGDLIYYENQDPIRTDFQTLTLHKKNRFIGSQCNIGVEQFIIDVWGRIFYGHCRVGGRIGMIGGNIRLPTTSITCQKLWCSNGFDIVATKF
jgi:pyruvate-formate lyase-activating enzyme